MKEKRHTTEEIIRILREADGGKTAQKVCREVNITEQTFLTTLTLFATSLGSRNLSWKWMISYNEERPHEALNNLTPTQYSNLTLSA